MGLFHYINVLQTQNVFVRRIENFLQASEVKVFVKNSHKVAGSAELQMLEFQNNPLESHFSFNKKCFVGRTVMNQNALYSPDLGDYFTYSQRMRTTHRKYSTGF